MLCHKHADKQAASTCIECGRGLCPECTQKYVRNICDVCNLNRVKVEKRSLGGYIAASVVLAGFFNFMFFKVWTLSHPITPYYVLMIPTLTYSAVSLPWGWKTVSGFSSNNFLMGNWFFWLILFQMKFFMASMIGLFVFPYHMYKLYKSFKVFRTVEALAK